MTKEWKNQFNSFNSWKGAFYFDWYKSIREWKEGQCKTPLPPVEASLDPIHACNLQCAHCNAASYLISNIENKKMSDQHLVKLIKFLGEWGVKAICFGGGGEPTLHTYLPEALYLTTEHNMESSIATNGTLFNEALIDSMARNCRWVGISIDAATQQTYKKGRKISLFYTAIQNMNKLVDRIRQLGTKCEVAYKFLIFDYNQHEIYNACRLAKRIGVKDFHARPADYSHQGMGDLKQETNPYDINLIKDQFKQCHKLETSDFRVFTIVHKFDNNFMPKKDFSQCYASPCCIQLCADGGVYLCPDQRHQKFYKLGNHSPNPRDIKHFWGRKRHYELVFETGRKSCNTRCTFNPYCKQCEELFIKDIDPMCWKFI